MEKADIQKKPGTVILLGSSNSRGNTHTIASFMQEQMGSEIIDLKEKDIHDFDYENAYANDDFIPIMEYVISNYDTLVLATPVYWYTMSATMKRFMDRFSDLLKFRKDLGRKLRGKGLAVISCGSDSELIDGFLMPFEESANYLGMKFNGHVHTWITDGAIEDEVKRNMGTFIQTLQ